MFEKLDADILYASQIFLKKGHFKSRNDQSLRLLALAKQGSFPAHLYNIWNIMCVFILS